MLSKQQFLDKHKEKFSNLSANERTKRYRDYQLSHAMRKAPGAPKISKPSKVSGPKELSYATMSECAKLYVHALLDPWEVPSPPCVPDNLTLPSYKYAARCRTNFVIGLQGVGFVVVDPYVFASTQPCLGITAASYPLNTVDINSTEVTYTSSDSSFPLTGYSPTSSIHWVSRIVGFGVRVRYVGSEMSRSGQVVAFREASNDGGLLLNPVTIATLLASRESVTVPADRKWHSAVWRPAAPRDITYYDDFVGFSDVDPAMGLVVTGATPGTSFEVDAVGWYETIGSSLPMLSRSHSDPLGMATVSASLSETQPTATPSQTVASFIRGATSIAQESLSFVGAVKPVVKAGLEIASLF